MPIAAAGPLKVLTKPIRMVSAAVAGPATAIISIPTSQTAVLMWIRSECSLVEVHLSEIATAIYQML
jgi:hypothetical protein